MSCRLCTVEWSKLPVMQLRVLTSVAGRIHTKTFRLLNDMLFGFGILFAIRTLVIHQHTQQ
jgi:hypothetical protein